MLFITLKTNMTASVCLSLIFTNRFFHQFDVISIGKPFANIVENPIFTGCIGIASNQGGRGLAKGEFGSLLDSINAS